MTAWLRCRLDVGMFSDEMAVTYPPVESKWQKSVFVPRSCVRQEEDARSGMVKVNVLVKDGTRFAVLPSQQHDVVKVHDGDLQQPK